MEESQTLKSVRRVALPRKFYLKKKKITKRMKREFQDCVPK